MTEGEEPSASGDQTRNCYVGTRMKEKLRVSTEWFAMGCFDLRKCLHRSEDSDQDDV
jgi:hypothetical protein